MDEPIANSSILVLPMMTTPASFNFFTTVESYGGRQSCKIFDPAVVGTSFCAKTSLRANGTPAKGDNFSPLLRRASTEAACASAPSESTCKNAFTSLSISEMRSRCALVNSTEVMAPWARASPIALALWRIIQPHLKFVEHENVTLLVLALPREPLQR